MSRYASWVRGPVLLAACLLLCVGAERWTRGPRGAWSGSQPGPLRFEDLLTAGAAWLTLAGTAWLCLVVAATVLEALARTQGRRLRVRVPAPRLLHRWLLALVGGALVAGLAAPAQADSTLPSPGRVAGAAPDTGQSPPRHDSGPSVVRVRAGDSLWTIARERHPGAGSTELAHVVRALHAANREVIGPDPDLIRPGQRLRMPSPTHFQETS